MRSVYFLDGLGSNRYYAEDLRLALAEEGLRLIYLPLPGHPDNLDTQLTCKEEVLDWLRAVLPEEPCDLLGYSLGADLAAAFAHHHPERVSRLVLLDGGCFDLSALPLAAELEGAQTYLDAQVFGDMAEHLNQARAGHQAWSANLERAEQEAYAFKEAIGLYQLKLTPETILALLTYRRAFGLSLQAADYQVPTHVIISDQPEETLAAKLTVLSATGSWVTHEIFAGAGHDVYMVYPQETAGRIAVAFRWEKEMDD